MQKGGGCIETNKRKRNPGIEETRHKRPEICSALLSDAREMGQDVLLPIKFRTIPSMMSELLNVHSPPLLLTVRCAPITSNGRIPKRG